MSAGTRTSITARSFALAVYGLPKLYAADIAQTNLTANPGCYPTSVILGLYAAPKNDLIETGDIVVDSKSGATGAGRKAAVPTLFCEVSDNFRACGLPAIATPTELSRKFPCWPDRNACPSIRICCP